MGFGGRLSVALDKVFANGLNLILGVSLSERKELPGQTVASDKGQVWNINADRYSSILYIEPVNITKVKYQNGLIATLRHSMQKLLIYNKGN